MYIIHFPEILSGTNIMTSYYITSYKDKWYLFWCQLKMETHSYTLVVNKEDVLHKVAQEDEG